MGKPRKAVTLATFKCPLCNKVVKRRVSKATLTVVSMCGSTNKTVLLERVTAAV